MPQQWNVGDSVKTRIENAWVYEGTERQNLMGRERRGTVVDVPWSTQHSGSGTVLVRWQSLTDIPLKRSDWWTHTDLIERA